MARTDSLWDTLNGGTAIQTIDPAGYDILINGTSKYLNFNTTVGSSGYGFRDNAGTMEFKNSAGAWAGIGSGGSVGPGTINEIAYFNSTSSIASLSVATYPSLTELAYVKGLTSSAQTQLNAKQPAGNYITALTGDGTASGAGSVTLTLATVNTNVGTFGSATQAPQLTVNGKGLITAVANVTITPAVGSITGLGTGIATALGVNIGLAGAPVLFNGALGTPTSGVATNLTGTASGLTAGLVTTNANLTGVVTSIGNATAIADNALSIAKTSGLQSALDLKAPLASPTFTGTVTVPTPTNATDAATKAYTDSIAQSLDIKLSVRVASTVNITIATALINGSTIDGIVVATGDRVLLKNQTAGAENGIYIVVASGVASRSTDADSSAEVTSGMYVFVSEGTVSLDTGYVLTTNDPITLGTTVLVFTQFSGAGQIVAGNGLSKSGNTLSINTAITADLSTVQTFTNKTLTSPIIANIAPGANFTLTQNSVVPFTSVNAGAVVNTLYLNAGNVGIGTTNPGAKLDVVGPAISSGANIQTVGDIMVGTLTGASIFFDGNYSYGTGNYIRAITTNTQGFFTTGAERMRITSTGNVGIGIATPSQLLAVHSPSNATAPKILIGQTGSIGWDLGLTTTTGNFKLEIDGGQTGIDVTRSGTSVQYVNFPNGNVGIGTAVPATALHISRDAVAYGEANAQLTIGGLTATGKKLIIGYNTTDNYAFLESANFGVAVTHLILNPSGGNVGIGTTAPANRFTVLTSGTINTGGDTIDVGASIIGQSINIGVGGNAALFNIVSNSTQGADVGGTLGFGGRYSTTQQAQFAIIKGAKEDGVSGNFGGYLAFGTRTTGNITERMRISGAGNVGIGTTTIPSMLTVNGLINMKNYTVATLPAGTQGDICYITDQLTAVTAKGIAPVGGGAFVSVVFRNATIWVGI